MKYTLLLTLIILVSSCQPDKKTPIEEPPKKVQVELTTSKGKILLELSNKTPLHRDNFVKIVKEGRLDSMLFHRVIQDFVVQAGLYDSLKTANMDSIERQEVDYLIPAEIDTTLFHKRGALGAARSDNPERASSSLSFYVVQRGPQADSLIVKGEERINGWLQKHHFINDPANKVWRDSLASAQDNENWELYAYLQDTINSMAKTFEFESYTIPEQHRQTYRNLGGTPHLDQNYTVFGEVIEGMAVVDSIAVVEVGNANRPVENVYLLTAKVLN